jgi:hypothetical protein
MALPENQTSILNFFPETKIHGIPVLDIWSAFSVSTDFQNKGMMFDKMLLEEGDRWDTLAEDIYGDRAYWWVIMIFNNIDDPFSIDYNRDITELAVSEIKILLPQYLPNLLGDIRRFRIESDE